MSILGSKQAVFLPGTEILTIYNYITRLISGHISSFSSMSCLKKHFSAALILIIIIIIASL